jgi:hypothetical protein
MSYQEVGIALLGRGEDSFRRLWNFALMLGLVASCGLGLIAFTPLADTWFHHVSGLSLELSRFSRLPTQILTFLPVLSVLLSFERAILVYGRTTKPITWTSIIEVAGIGIVLFICIQILGMVGAVAATTALFLGRIGGNVYLIPHCLRVLKQFEL